MRPPPPAAPATPSWRGGVCVFAPLAVAALALAGCAHHDYARYEPRPIDPAKTAAAFETHRLDDPGLRKFLRENFRADFPLTGTPEGGWDFEALCWVAFYFNPTLDVARAQWESARAAQTTAGERPNPTLTLTPGFSANPNGASPWLPAIGADFTIETAGKRDLRAEAARLTAESARQEVFAAAWRVRSELRSALLDIVLATRRHAALDAVLQPQQNILALLEQRRAAGAGTAAESAATRLAILKAEIAAADAARQIPLARQRVASALGMPAIVLSGIDMPVPRNAIEALRWAVPLFDGVGEGLPDRYRVDEARRQSLHSRADVLAALARYAAAESALAVEIAKQHPDIHLGPGYQWDQGQNKWTLGVTLELPILNHNEGAIAEATARRREAAAQFNLVQAQVLAEIDGAVAAITAAGEQAVGVRRAEAELASQRALVESRLKAGGASQLDLQAARLEIITNNQVGGEAAAQIALAAGQLEDALQIPLAHLEVLAPPERAAPAKPVSKKSP